MKMYKLEVALTLIEIGDREAAEELPPHHPLADPLFKAVELAQRHMSDVLPASSLRNVKTYDVPANGLDDALNIVRDFDRFSQKYGMPATIGIKADV